MSSKLKVTIIVSILFSLSLVPEARGTGRLLLPNLGKKIGSDLMPVRFKLSSEAPIILNPALNLSVYTFLGALAGFEGYFDPDMGRAAFATINLSNIDHAKIFKALGMGEKYPSPGALIIPRGSRDFAFHQPKRLKDVLTEAWVSISQLILFIDSHSGKGAGKRALRKSELAKIHTANIIALIGTRNHLFHAKLAENLASGVGGSGKSQQNQRLLEGLFLMTRIIEKLLNPETFLEEFPDANEPLAETMTNLNGIVAAEVQKGKGLVKGLITSLFTDFERHFLYFLSQIERDDAVIKHLVESIFKDNMSLARRFGFVTGKKAGIDFTTWVRKSRKVDLGELALVTSAKTGDFLPMKHTESPLVSGIDEIKKRKKVVGPLGADDMMFRVLEVTGQVSFLGEAIKNGFLGLVTIDKLAAPLTPKVATREDSAAKLLLIQTVQALKIIHEARDNLQQSEIEAFLLNLSKAPFGENLLNSLAGSISTLSFTPAVRTEGAVVPAITSTEALKVSMASLMKGQRLDEISKLVKFHLSCYRLMLSNAVVSGMPLDEFVYLRIRDNTKVIKSFASRSAIDKKGSLGQQDLVLVELLTQVEQLLQQKDKGFEVMQPELALVKRTASIVGAETSIGALSTAYGVTEKQLVGATRNWPGLSNARIFGDLLWIQSVYGVGEQGKAPIDVIKMVHSIMEDLHPNDPLMGLAFPQELVTEAKVEKKVSKPEVDIKSKSIALVKEDKGEVPTTETGGKPLFERYEYVTATQQAMDVARLIFDVQEAMGTGGGEAQGLFGGDRIPREPTLTHLWTLWKWTGMEVPPTYFFDLEGTAFGLIALNLPWESLRTQIAVYQAAGGDLTRIRDIIDVITKWFSRIVDLRTLERISEDEELLGEIPPEDVELLTAFQLAFSSLPKIHADQFVTVTEAKEITGQKSSTTTKKKLIQKK